MTHKFYQCLNCSVEFEQINQKNGKFHDRECYKLYRKANGTKAVVVAQAILLRTEPDKPRVRKTKIKEPKVNEPQVKEPQENVIAPLPDADNIPTEEVDNIIETAQQSASIDFCDLTISELRELLGDLLTINEQQDILINERDNTIGENVKLLNEKSERVVDLELVIEEKNKALSDLSKIKPSEPKTMDDAIKIFLTHIAQIEMLKWTKGELKNQKMDPSRIELKEGERRCMGCYYPFTPEEQTQMFCSDECVVRRLPKNSSMSRYDGRIINGERTKTLSIIPQIKEVMLKNDN